MGIYAQRVDARGLWIKSRSGEVTLTPAQVLQYFTDASRDKNLAMRRFLTAAADVLQVDPRWLRFDFDEVTGEILDFGVSVGE